MRETESPAAGAGSSGPAALFAAINARDVGAIVADLAEDAEWSWPGSGEVIRAGTIACTPSVHRIIGGPDLVGAVWTADYGDGVPWRNISLFEFRDGRSWQDDGLAP